ncbi:MAG: hypothetical protein J1E63_07610 [Muribaculaceae bacterium]|nr:hypothetical protein [Muribaculaceae bacterium]
MEAKKAKTLSTLASRLTAIVSVTLVLLLLGLTGGIGLATRELMETVREELGFVVVMRADATTSNLNTVKQTIGRAPYTSSYSFSSPQEVHERYLNMIGADSAERAMLETLEITPFLPEFDVHVKSAYLHNDSLETIIASVQRLPGVENVTARREIINDIGQATQRVMITLLTVAAALLLISFVLINNTVRLSVYARRFIINTMSLVGATDSYIRRPFLLSAAKIGLIAGGIADVFYIIIKLTLPGLDAEMATLMTWTDTALLVLALPIIGIIVCTLAAWIATNRYLRRNYNQLYD